MKNKYFFTKFACYVGFVVQAIVNNFLPILFIALQNVYGFDYERLARLILINFATQMITDISAPKILKITGLKAASFLSQFCAALGLVMMGILPKILHNGYFAITISAVVYAYGSGLMEVILSPFVEALPSNNKAGSMSILHSFYCWGQAFTVIVTTALAGVFGYAGWSYIPLIWAIIPFLNSLLFLKVPIIEPEQDKKLASFGELLKRRNFRGYMLMMLCAGASEIAMAEWSSLFAQKALGVTKAIGDIAGPCAFAVFMAIGRVFYAAFSKKLSFKKVLMVLSISAFICYMTVAISQSAAVSLIFCAICGFTVSVFWPGLYSAGARDFPDGGMIMYSVFAMCGDIGCGLGPWILGAVADRAGLNFGFGAAAFFPAIMFVTALSSVSRLKNNNCKNKTLSV